jgi:hypothetical protein
MGSELRDDARDEVDVLVQPLEPFLGPDNRAAVACNVRDRLSPKDATWIIDATRERISAMR